MKQGFLTGLTAALALSQAWATGADSRAPELKMPDLSQTTAQVAALAKKQPSQNSNDSSVVLPAPAGKVIKAKLTRDEISELTALAARIYDKKGAEGSLQSLSGLHRFGIEGDVLPDGAFRLKTIKLFQQKHIYLVAGAIHALSIDLDGTISSFDSLGLGYPDLSVEDPVAQNIIKREIAFWIHYAQKHGIWTDGLLHGDPG